MRSLTVWFFNHYAVPTTEAGGSRHHALARALAERGHRIVLIASCRNYQAPGHSRLADHETSRLDTIDGVEFLWLKTPAYGSKGPARLRNMLAYAGRVTVGHVLRQLPSPDVVIGSSPHPFAALAAWWVAFRRRVPFVLEVRDLWPQSLIDVGGMSPRHPFVLVLSVIERFLYRRARTVVSLLPGAADYVRQVAERDCDVAWIPNGVDVGLIPWPNRAPDAERFTIMYAGAHGTANGLDTILDAAAMLEREAFADRLSIRFVGDGPEKPRLLARATELRLRCVSFEDQVPKTRIYSRLAEADAFLMVLKDSPVFRWGVSPNKLFDYMATGRPVIFGVSTPYNPIASSGAGLTVPPGDPAALAAAIRNLMNTPRDARLAMGVWGREYVLESHSSAKLALRLEGVLARAHRAEERDGRASGRRARPWSMRIARKRRRAYPALKRVVEFLGAAALLIILSPILVSAAVVVRARLGSPILFRQTRPGLHGNPFVLYKFRTMRDARDARGVELSDGQRLTRLGKFLRSTSIDELPELFNVLRGDMSLVGPRPLLTEYLPLYSPEQARRHEVRPGITGWAQVNGRNAIGWPERFAMDVWYVDNQGPLLDLRILALTVGQVVRRHGISQPGEATMTKFRGNAA